MKTKSKAKGKTYIFTKGANCATLSLFVSVGDVVEVYDRHIYYFGMKYPRAIEIDLFIRDGVLVDPDTPEAERALELAGVQNEKRRDKIEYDEEGNKIVRGMKVESQEEFQVVRHIEPAGKTRRSQAARSQEINRERTAIQHPPVRGKGGLKEYENLTDLVNDSSIEGATVAKQDTAVKKTKSKKSSKKAKK